MSSDPTVQTQNDLGLRAADTPDPVNTASGTAEVAEQERDLVLPAIFLTGAALILAWLDPLYFQFRSYPIETIVVVLVELALVWFAVWRRNMALLYIGVGLVLATLAVQSVTQPSPLSVPIVAIWPLRMLLVVLVGVPWAFLMRPPGWLNRGLVAFVVSTVLVLGFWGGPATGAALFGWNVALPIVNFSPYWLAIDSHNTVYASDTYGGVVWVFDQSGSARGTIRPARAPAVGTPGPGVLPVGIEEELRLAHVSLLPTPAPTVAGGPTTGAVPGVPLLAGFDFCGLAVDGGDNLYTIDTSNPPTFSILQFNPDGNITGRWAMPSDYGPTRGCIAADNKYLYVASRFGAILVYDFDGNLLRTIPVAYQPFGIAPDHKGKLLVLGPNLLNRIDPETSTIVTSTLPMPQQNLTIPYQALAVLQDGDVLVTDVGNNQVLRINSTLDAIMAKLGGQGVWPGEFQWPGGLAQDAQGRIYIADAQNRVIQRFDANGKVEAIWWAARSYPENQTSSDGDNY